MRRRCWGLRGIRVVKPVQQKYQWGYLYGALDVVEGTVEFCFLPLANLDLTKRFLEQIAASDPEANHVVTWDQARFHYSSRRIPEGIHLLPLPAYSPELNAIEKLWGRIKDRIAKRIFPTLDYIEQTLAEALRPYWESTESVLKLVGKGWLHHQANAT